MGRFLPRIVVVAIALIVSSSPSTAATALVWSTGNNGLNTGGVASYIKELGCFTAVDAESVSLLPLSTLMNYDAVFYFSNHSEDQDPVLIGNVLADYADTGRRLVISTFAWAEQGANTLGGRLITDGISPLLADGTTAYAFVSMSSNDGSTFFTGVSTVDGFYHDNVKLTPGATLRGSWSDGEPLLADKNNVVAVDLFPDEAAGLLGGDYRRLFANALCRQEPVAAETRTWGSVKALYR